MCWAAPKGQGGICHVVEGDGVVNGNMKLNGHTLTYIAAQNWNPAIVNGGIQIGVINALELTPDPTSDALRADKAKKD